MVVFSTAWFPWSSLSEQALVQFREFLNSEFLNPKITENSLEPKSVTGFLMEPRGARQRPSSVEGWVEWNETHHPGLTPPFFGPWVLVEDVERREVLFVESSVSGQEPVRYFLGMRADEEIGEHSISFSAGFEMLLPLCACGISRFEVQ